MFYVIGYVKKEGVAEDYDLNNLVVVVETKKDVVEYISRVAAWMELHCQRSDYYTGPPEVLLAVDGRVVHRGCDVLSFEDLVRWILDQCDMPSSRRFGGTSQRYPLSDSVPVTRGYKEVPGTFPLE
jgi:hypothetical protein